MQPGFEGGLRKVAVKSIAAKFEPGGEEEERGLALSDGISP